MTSPHIIPAKILNPYFRSTAGSSSAFSILSGQYFLQMYSTPAMMILLNKYRLIWQLIGVFLPKTSPPTMKPAKKLFMGRFPNSLASTMQASLQQNTKVPNFLPCSQAFLTIALMVLALNDLNKKVMTSECTNLTRLPYSSPLRSPLSVPSASPAVMSIMRLGVRSLKFNQLLINILIYCVIMAKRTKKVGVTGKYGTRYGSTIRKIVKKFQLQQRAKYVCPACGKSQVRRAACGIWKCRGCKITFAGGAFEFATSVATTAKVTMTRLKKLKEELNNNKEEEVKEPTKKAEKKEKKAEKKAKAPKA